MDEELIRIREKKMRDMQKKIEKSVGNVVYPINQDQFPQFMKDHAHLVIDFWAEWCGPCRQVSPVIDELAREFAPFVIFAKCNTDENPRLAQRLGISAIPTLMFFSSGVMIKRLTGAYPEETIRAEINRVFDVPVK